MSNNRPFVAPGFHEGELAVQQRAGVRSEATRLLRMLAPADLSGRAAGFLASQNLAVLSGRDPQGRFWIVPLTGPTGFLEATTPSTLRIYTSLAPGDPLHDLTVGQPAGLLVIDPARRHRYRINGWLTMKTAHELTIEAEQAYGNCPQYIQQRTLVPAPSESGDARPDQHDATNHTPTSTEGPRLSPADIAQIKTADTFFLGTTHPDRGNDASHRGGPAGFVRIEDYRHLWWPDYRGNNMFNSLGNLAVDPTAALLFYDFSTGRTLHLTGTAKLLHTTPGDPGDDGYTGRRVAYTVDQVVRGPRAALLAEHPDVTRGTERHYRTQ